MSSAEDEVRVYRRCLYEGYESRGKDVLKMSL